MKKFLLCLLTCILTISLCSCSFLKSSVYITGDIEDGFEEIDLIDGITFVVPEDIKDEAMSEGELVKHLTSENIASEEDVISAMEKLVVEIYDDTDYAITAPSQMMIAVGPVALDDDLDDFEDQDDLYKAIKKDKDDVNFKVKNSWTKGTFDDTVKIICPVEYEIGKDDGLSKNFEHFGYLAVIENDDGDQYMMLAVSTDEDKDDDMKYMAKSFAFTGDDLPTSSDKSNESNNDNDINNDDNSPDVDDSLESSKTPDESNDNERDESGTNDGTLKSLTLVINGSEMKLGDTFKTWSNIKKLNADDDTLDNLDSFDTSTIFLEDSENPYSWLMIEVANFSDEDNVPINNCIVYSVSFDADDVYDENNKEAIDVVLPGNIKLKSSTYDDIIAAYGTPSEVYEMDDFDIKELTWDLKVKEGYITYMVIDIDTTTNTADSVMYYHAPQY